MAFDHDISIATAREKALPVVGPVSRAIAVMRAAEPSPLRFETVHGEPVRKGHYIARRRGWRSDAHWTVVLVHYDSDVPGRMNVHEAGSSRVDDPAEWVFSARVAGVDELPAPISYDA